MKKNTQTIAVEQVMKELNSLGGGRQNLTTQDVLDLRKHAKLRTDLTLLENELSEEQKVWKILHNTLDEQLEKMLGHDEKMKIEGMLQDMDNLKTIQKGLELKIKRHGAKDNGRFIFYSFLIVGFLLSWVLTGSFLWAIALGIIASVIGLFIGASIFESGYSQGSLGRYIDKIGQFTGSTSLVHAGNNMISKSMGLDEIDKCDNNPNIITQLHK